MTLQGDLPALETQQIAVLIQAFPNDNDLRILTHAQLPCRRTRLNYLKEPDPIPSRPWFPCLPTTQFLSVSCESLIRYRTLNWLYHRLCKYCRVLR